MNRALRVAMAFTGLRRWEARDFGGAIGGVTPPYGRTTQTAGVLVSPETALRNSAVWACVRLKADTMSMLPVSVADMDELPDVLVSPDPDWTRQDWMFQAVVSLELRGNVYAAVVERDETSALPTQLLLLNPDTVTPFRATSGPDIGKLRYRVGSKYILEPSDMLHIRGFTQPGRDTGLSVIEYAATTIGVGMAAEGYGAGWFRDSAHPAAVLSTGQALNATAAAALQSQWQELHGAGNRKIAILTADLKYQPIQIAPAESQFIETLAANVTTIARWFGVPPHKIGDLDRATFSNIEQQQIEYTQDGVLPMTVRFEQAFERLLRLPPDAVRYDVDEIQRGDIATRYTAYAKKRQWGAMSADEWRAKDGEPPIANGAGGDFLIPLNMSKADRNDDAKSQLAKSQAALALVTAGYDPEAVVAALDLPPMAYIGPPPKTALAQGQIDPMAPLADDTPAPPDDQEGN